MKNYNNQIKKRNYQNNANKKKENLEKGDLIWMLSPVHNDYYRKTSSKHLGQNKIRPGYISKELISPNNKKYFVVTHGTSNEIKGKVEFYVEKGGPKYLFNPTDTYVYTEEQLNSLQREYISPAHPETISSHKLLENKIKRYLPDKQRDNIRRTISAIQTGKDEEAKKIIQERFPEPTREDVWDKKVHDDARMQFKSGNKREEYIDKHLHNYPWLDDEPSE